MSIFSAGGDKTAILTALNKSQAIIEFKLDGTIITANENFLSALGYKLEDIKGRHHSMFVEPAYRDSAEYRQFWEKLNRGEYQAAQYKRIGKGGKEVWIEASYNPIFSRRGRLYKVVKFATDVSKEKAVFADLLGKVDAIGRSQGVIEFNLNGKLCKVVKFATDLSARKQQNAALARDFENGVKSLVTAVSASAGNMEATAQSLAAAAEQTSKQSATVSATSEELAAS